MWDETFWNATRRSTKKKSHFPASCAKRHSETSRENTHRKETLCLQDVQQDILKCHAKIHTREKLFSCRMCDETFWNDTWRNTQEKSLQDVRRNRCQLVSPLSDLWPETSRENAIQWQWHSETSQDTHRRKTIAQMIIFSPNYGEKICGSNMLKPNHQMKYLSTTLTETQTHH